MLVRSIKHVPSCEEYLVLQRGGAEYKLGID